MGLLVIDDTTGKVRPVPELLAVPCWSTLWSRRVKIDGDPDGSKKRRNLAEITYIYFAVTPTSRFRGIRDKKEKEKKLKEISGLPQDWKPDEVVEDCIKDYREEVSLPVAPEEKILKSAEDFASSLSTYLDQKSLQMITGSLTPIDVNNLMNIADRIKKTVENVKEARTVLNDVADRAAKTKNGRTMNKYELP